MCPGCLLSVVFISKFIVTHVRGHSLVEGKKKWECLSHSDPNVSLNVYCDFTLRLTKIYHFSQQNDLHFLNCNQSTMSKVMDLQ